MMTSLISIKPHKLNDAARQGSPLIKILNHLISTSVKSGFKCQLTTTKCVSSEQQNVNVFLKMGHSRHLFLYFDLFNSWHCLCSLKIFADDWIRTSDLWVRKQPLCQLSHNNCPRECKCFFVGWAISRCLSTTPHPIGGQGVVYFLYINL